MKVVTAESSHKGTHYSARISENILPMKIKPFVSYSQVKPEQAGTALRMCVCMSVCLSCLLVCLRPYTVNFKLTHLHVNSLQSSNVLMFLQLEGSVSGC